MNPYRILGIACLSIVCVSISVSVGIIFIRSALDSTIGRKDKLVVYKTKGGNIDEER